MTPSDTEFDALIERLIASCGDDDDIDDCGQCLEEFVQAGKRAVPALIGLVEDWDQWTDVRMAAVEALGRIGDKSATKALERALENDPNTDVQGAAAQALGRLRPSRSIARLLRALDTTDLGKQMDTIMALAHARSLAASSKLTDLANQMDAAGDNGVAGVTRAAVVYIKEGISGPKSILDDKDQDIELRRGAASVLDQAHHLDAIPILLRCLRDDDEEIRSAAFQSLIVLIYELKPQGTAIGRDIVSALIESLSSDPSGRCRNQAAELLGAMGDPVALTALEKATEDPDKFVRRISGRALEALRKIQEKS